MITLTAKIDIISGNNGTLSGVSINNSRNDISSSIGSILGVKKQPRNPFIIGASKVGDGSTFSSGEDYFIGSWRSNESGQFSTPYQLTISGEDIDTLTIQFDTLNNRHPNRIWVNNVEYRDDDPIFTINNLGGVDEVIITFVDWNAPNYPAVITGIYQQVTYEIDRRNLLGISSSIFDRGDYKLPSYGIISNSGSIEFVDYNREVLDCAEMGLLVGDLKAEITLNNTLNGKSETIAIMETEQWNYDNNNRSVSVSLKDDLVEWQDIYVEGITIDPRKIYDEPLSYIYNYLWEITSNRTYGSKIGKGNYNMLALEELDQDTQNVLNNVYTKYPLLDSGNLWQQWTKLCQVCQLHIYKDNQGIIVCRYNGGN